MKTQSYEIGMVGLSVMGRNLLLNIADQGHSVAGYDKDATKVAALYQEAENRGIHGTDLRVKTLAEHGIQFLGVGASGGEHGARHGPSIMAGGPARSLPMGSAGVTWTLIQAQLDYFGAHTL